MLGNLPGQIRRRPDPYSKNGYERECFAVGKIDIEMHVHRSDSSRVIIIYPGADGSIDGYNLKYRKIANWLADSGVASVVRIDNLYCVDFLPYVEMMILKLAYVIDCLLDNSERLFGRQEIDFCFAGVSAGAGAGATVLSDYPFIKKVLLIAPYVSVGRDNIERGLKSYEGELFLVAGLEDEISAHELAKDFFDISISKHKDIYLVPGCDHQFKGRKNGLILSSSFMWAFSDHPAKPDKSDGILLY